MTDTTTPLTRHELEAKIVKRCWENEAFRQEFVSDPAGTFARHLNLPAASVPSVVVHEEAPGTWHIVIPARPEGARELSDSDLEKVAAGVSPTIIIGTVSLAVSAAGSGAVSYGGMVSFDDGW